MKKNIAAMIFVLLSAFCITNAQARPKADPDVQICTADLTGPKSKEDVKIEDKFATDSAFVLTISRKNKDKTIKLIDTVTIPGKIRRFELIELNGDGQNQIVLYFDGLNSFSNIAIYQLKNNKLQKIFAAASEYGIEGDFDLIPRIKIGKPLKNSNSPNLVPDVDNWVWIAGKFVKE